MRLGLVLVLATVAVLGVRQQVVVHRPVTAPAPAPVIAPAPAAAPQVAGGEVRVRFAGPCQAGCLTLAAWDRLAPDAPLRAGLALAYHHHPEWRPFARIAADRGTRVATTTERAIYFSPARNGIFVHEAMLREPTAVLAAVMAHEVYHAAQGTAGANTRDGAGDCFEEEMQAYAWEAATWARLPRGGAATTYARQLDRLVERWRARTLRDFVVTLPLYHRQCFGRELPAF